VFVHGDLLRLEQIVWNLLTNAVKFTLQAARFRFTSPRQIKKSCWSSKTRPGIEKSFLPKVFEMFRQGDARASREHAGMGIGLALVQQLVRLHEGSVTADSEGPGKGTTITLCLPAKAEGKLPLPRPRRSSERKAGSDYRAGGRRRSRHYRFVALSSGDEWRQP
jgi:signal transduction histidine kinase